MTDQPLDWLTEQPAATLILAAYADLEAQLPKRSPRRADAAEIPVVPTGENEPPAESEAAANDEENAEAWIPRISTVEGVESTVLSQLHGGLIARGYLKYELFGRQIGMRYRLTPEGRRAAEHPTVIVAETSTTAAESASLPAETMATDVIEIAASEAIETAAAESIAA
jgi:hypothetical protein